MANPNLLSATSIYGKNVTASGTGSEIVVLTCPTDKLIKVTSINIHRTGGGGGGNCVVKIDSTQITGVTQPVQNSNFTYGSFYLTEGQQIRWNASNDTYSMLVSYEEIDDA